MSEPPVKRDSLALPSLITGVLGFFGVTAVLGMVFGVVTLVRTRRTGERGRGLAIGGIVASVAWMVAIPVASILLLSVALKASNTPILSMRPDDCYNAARPGIDAVKVPCAAEHDGVVLDSFTMAGPQVPYPGDRKVHDTALSVCTDRLKNALGESGVSPAEPVIVGYGPDETAWAAGMRVAVCGFESRQGPWRG